MTESTTVRPVSTPPKASIAATGDLNPEDFRRVAHAVVDWITDYLENPSAHPVRSRVRPGEIRNALRKSPPEHGEPLDAMLMDFYATLLPGITHWNHPSFFAYFANSAAYPGILAELLSAALNANGMLWITSPAVTELEELAIDWLRQMLGLSAGWTGQISDTASMSTFLALAAARERAGLDVRVKGLAGRTDVPRMRVYCSEHVHSSIDKAVMALGIGHENCIKIPADDQFRMKPDALEAAIVADKAAGFLPIAVVPCVGTTSTASIDPVAEVVRIARQHNLWVHVDGAYGGMAAVVPELQYVLNGVDGADSLVVNPHKWLFTPVDCSVFFMRDRDVLRRAFALLPDYLVTKTGDSATNLMDYGIQLGRRFRALKLWMIIRAYGTEGLAERLRHHCELAREFAGMVHFEGGWELMAPVSLALVCFRWAPKGASEETLEKLNAEIMERVNSRGHAYLSHTKLNGRYTLRLSIGNIRTDREHVELAWRELREAAAAVSAS